MPSEEPGPDSPESPHNFTPRAQQVLRLARSEADRFKQNFVGTEHLLLGIIKLGQGVAVNVLQKLGIDLESVRREVEKQVGRRPHEKLMVNIPYTPRVKKVLAFAQEEAKALNHTYVGTEHILLGLLREHDGVAARVLMNLGVDIEQTRQEVLKELDPNRTATVAGHRTFTLEGFGDAIEIRTVAERRITKVRGAIWWTPASDTTCIARSKLTKSLFIVTRFSRARKASSPSTRTTVSQSLWSSNKPTAKPSSLPGTQ